MKRRLLPLLLICVILLSSVPHARAISSSSGPPLILPVDTNAEAPDISDFSFSFENLSAAFGYPSAYYIPGERYTFMYGSRLMDDKTVREVFNEVLNENRRWNGNCFGMIAASLLLSQPDSGVSVKDFRPDATRIDELSVDDKNTALNGMTLTELIEALQVMQYSCGIQISMFENEGKLSAVCDRVSAFQSGKDTPVIILVYGKSAPDSESIIGEALVGYRLSDVSGSESRLYVYDVNHPGDAERYITLTKDAGQYTGWSYPRSENMTWDSSQDEGDITCIPYDVILTEWNNRGKLMIYGDSPFEDVLESHYFYNAVLWAVYKGVTNGVTATSFQPYRTCSRGHIITFLWRAAGQPEPTSPENPFSDVSGGSYYSKAAMWAYENELETGITFSASTPCTRAAVVEYLWKLTGRPATSSENPFEDVPDSANYARAVVWAMDKGITTGVSPTSFRPDQTCTRAQIVTFLYRYNRNVGFPEPVVIKDGPPSPEWIGKLSFDFANSEKDFNYPPKYYIPMARYKLIFGDTALAKQIYKDDWAKGWRGNCYGMSVTSAILFQTGNEISPSDFRKDANVPKDLRYGDYNETLELTLRDWIEAIQISQKRSAFCRAYWKNLNDLDGLCKAVSSFQKTENQPVVICVYGTIEEETQVRGRTTRERIAVGHALLGYHLEEVSDTESRLYVYDCNYPNDGDRCLTITKSDGSYAGWSYDVRDDVKWESENDSNASITYIPYEAYWSDWERRGTIEQDMSNLTSNSSDAVIYDVDGEVVARFENGKMTENRGDVYPVVEMGLTADGHVVPASPGFSVWLPSNEVYTVSNSGTSKGKTEVSLVNVDKGLSVSTTAGSMTIAAEDATALREVIIRESNRSTTVALLSGADDDRDVVWKGITPSTGELKIQTSASKLTLDGTDRTTELTVSGQDFMDKLTSGTIEFPLSD